MKFPHCINLGVERYAFLPKNAILAKIKSPGFCKTFQFWLQIILRNGNCKMVVALKQCIFNPSYVKPKCVCEVADFLEKL